MTRGRILIVKLVLAAALALTVLGAAAQASQASYDLIKIRSIFRGPNDPTGAFVELQMYADGQTQLTGHNLNIWDATMNSGIGITLGIDVPSGQNQRMILLRDAGSVLPTDFAVTNLGMNLTTWASGGLMCWDTVDCVSWGNFSGSPPSPAANPIGGGLSGSMVSVRTIGRGCPTALDPADDTNDSTADFGFAVGYQVRDNSATPTETLCPPALAMSPTTATATAVTPTRKKCKRKKRRNVAAVAKKRCKKKKGT